MNDLKIKKLLKKDESVPTAPRNELHLIHQKIVNQKLNLSSFFSLKPLALACCLVIIVVGINLNLSNTSDSYLSETEQQELIEYMLEDAYLNNGESSYAWIDVN